MSGTTSQWSHAKVRPVRARPGLDLVGDHQHVAFGAQRAHPRQVVVRRNDDARLALDGLEQHGDGVLVDRGGHRVGVTEGHRPESRCVRTEAAARGVVVGEADDRRGAAVEVVMRHDDVGLAGGDALDVGAPLAGDLDAALDGFGAAVHRQHHVLAAQFGQRRAERGRAGRSGTPGSPGSTVSSWACAVAVTSGLR